MSREEPTKKQNQEERILNEILRPKSFQEFVGQHKLKKQLNLILEAAKKRGEVFDHLIFYGPPGLGKTTLAHIIAAETGRNLKATAGPAIEKAGDLAALLTNLEPNDIIFIDEIHRLPKVLEEILYLALEDRILNIMIGKGPGGRSVQLTLPPFSLLAATTRIGLISAPLRNRFGGVFQIDFYNNEDIEKIIHRSSEILKTNIDEESVKILAAASRATPRVANRLLKRTRDFAELKNIETIDRKATEETLKILELDEMGLERNDLKLLKSLLEIFKGKAVGLQSLAAILGEEEENIREVYEPFLLRAGLIERTSKGRTITPKGIEYLKKK